MKLVVVGWETFVYALPPAPNPSSDIVRAIGARYYSRGKMLPEVQTTLFGHTCLVYEAIGVTPLTFEVLKLLGPNSIFIFTGIPGLKGPIEMDADHLMRDIVLKNQVVLGTVNASSENFHEAIRDIGVFHQRWPRALRALITSRSSLEEAPGLLLGKIDGIKNVITFGPVH
jgi:glucose 1-dehydrogenase